MHVSNMRLLMNKKCVVVTFPYFYPLRILLIKQICKGLWHKF